MAKDKYNVRVNEQEWTLDADTLDLDFIENADGSFHVLHQQKSYKAKITNIDFAAKTIELKVNGNTYMAEIADQHDQLVKKLGLTLASSQKMNSVKAPMPGLVLDVVVKEGQRIAKGDTLLILEAMKMENVIKAIGEGTVKKVHASKGMAIDKGELLIELK